MRLAAQSAFGLQPSGLFLCTGASGALRPPDRPKAYPTWSRQTPVAMLVPSSRLRSRWLLPPLPRSVYPPSPVVRASRCRRSAIGTNQRELACHLSESSTSRKLFPPAQEAGWTRSAKLHAPDARTLFL